MTKNDIQLAYIGARGDIAAWRAFAAELHGMQVIQAGETLLIRIDEKAWRMAVRPADSAGVDYVGFEVSSSTDFDAILTRLKGAGVAVEESAALAAQRQVNRLARFEGPGRTIYELCQELMVATEPFCSPLGTNFVTGDLGLGHIGLSVDNVEEAYRFFVDLLGFRRTDSFSIPPNPDKNFGAFSHFIRGNRRHHLIALIQVPDMQGVHHVFVEVDDLVSLGRAWDRVEAGAAPVVLTLGQHSNDPVLSYYCESPSGFALEYGWKALVVDDENWVPFTWVGGELWGHHMPQPKA